MKNKIIALLALLVPSFGMAKPLIVTGYASWYGHEYTGRTMANGQKFDHRVWSVASWDFPLGTLVHIRYKSASGQTRQAYARVTDRGPSRDLTDRRFDFSHALFRHLESPKKGLIKVTVTEVILDGHAVTK